MTKSYSVLSLGIRKDAHQWRKHMNGTATRCIEHCLGYTLGSDVRHPRPSQQDVGAFFGRSDDWLFFGGHFFDEPPQLYNQAETNSVYFEPNQVRYEYQGGTVTLVKGQGFMQHQKVKAIFWGGCNVATLKKTVVTLRALFGSTHLMIGWKAKTGWEVLHSIMGGFKNDPPHARRDFFERVVGHDTDLDKVRDAWMKTSIDTKWGEDNIDDRVSVIDPAGQEWIIQNASIAPGRVFGP